MAKNGSLIQISDHNGLWLAISRRPENRPIPEPGNGEVQISVQKVGICGSDVHYWTHGEIGDFVVKKPMLLGHESSGVVTKLGAGVTHLNVGDRVALEPGVPCRHCEFCRDGRYNLCADIAFLATPPIHGDLSRFHVHDAAFCYKLPNHVSFEEGALLEPLSVGVHACKRAELTLGQNVLICGAGPIGLVCMITAKAMGAGKVCMTDISESRLNVAKCLGADFTVLVQKQSEQDISQAVCKSLGAMPDVTIECSGAETSVRSAIYSTKSGGVLVLVGLGAEEIKVPIINASVRELTIKGIFRYRHTYPAALSMIASGKVDLKPLITHRYDLEQSLDAFETARTGAGGAIKVMINCAEK